MRHNVRQRAAVLVEGVDPWLTLAFLGLMCFGVLMVYSASVAESYAYYGTPYYYLEHEIVWAGLGLVALLAAARLDYRRWLRLAPLLFGLAVLLLFLVMVPHVGHASHGARRWIALSSSVVLEPSELVKLALVVYMAAWLSSKGQRVRDFKACFVPFSLMVGMICLLIVKQPDLGTSIVVGATALAVFFLAGANVSHLLLAALGSVSFASLLTRSQSYQHNRLSAFLNPWSDPSGVGYHTIQALLALRYGGVFGRGLGNSVQKNVLPAPHTDSILAVIGEEWGLVGALFVLLLFLVIAYRGMRISARAPDNFGKLLAAGITCWITFQALMNFAVITSSVPFTGVPLPFVSYGGTSLIISMSAVGILLNVSRHASGAGFAGASGGRTALARQDPHYRRGHRRTRVPRVIHHPLPEPPRGAKPGRRGTGPRPRLNAPPGVESAAGPSSSIRNPAT